MAHLSTDFRIRPPVFSGETDKFQDFHFKFRAYVALTEDRAEQLLDQAEYSQQEIDDEHLDFGQHGVTDERLRARIAFSRKLFYVLVTITEKAALLIVQSVTTGNGFEAWRKLCQRYKPQAQLQSMGTLTTILEVTFPELNFEDHFSFWESEIQKYESTTRERLPVDIKIGILMSRTSGSLRDYLRLHAAELGTIEDTERRYQTVRSTVLEYVRSKQIYQRPSVPLSVSSGKAPSGPTPMEVDVVYKGASGFSKGKGKEVGTSKGFKGHGKGAKGMKGQGTWTPNFGGGASFNFGKGSGKNRPYFGKGKGKKGAAGLHCSICGRQGHTSETCWRRPTTSMIVEDEWGESGYDEGYEDYDYDDYAVPSSSWHSDAPAWEQDPWEPWLDSDWHETSGWQFDPWSRESAASSTSNADFAKGHRASQDTGSFVSPVSHSSLPSASIASVRADVSPQVSPQVSPHFAGSVSHSVSHPIFQQGTNTSERIAWNSGLTVAAMSNWQDDILLVDSGASCCVCPIQYRSDLPLLSSITALPQLRSVTGQLLKVHGIRSVCYLIENGMKMTVNYYVADVRFPVLSVGTLTTNGFAVTMSPSGSSISKDGKSCPLRKIGAFSSFATLDALMCPRLLQLQRKHLLTSSLLLPLHLHPQQWLQHQ
jgi:hypothetical protein